MDPGVPLEPSFHPSTCVKQGFLTTPSNHSIFYELHHGGVDSDVVDEHGQRKSEPVETDAAGLPRDRVLLLCGMYSTSSSALLSLVHLTNRGSSVLVMDNRGVGLSSANWGRYSTSAMASDASALLDHIGWTDDRSVHVVGVSLGGMVAQELALAIPTRIASLILTSTRAGPIPELPSFKVGGMLARQITRTIRGPEHAAALAVDCLFPSAWLDQPDNKNPGTTRRETLQKEYVRKAAVGQPSIAGKLGQFAAVTSHYVSPRKLGSVLSTIPRVHIIVGSEDQLIAPRRSKQLHDMIPGSTFRLVEGGGHTLPLQYEEEYHQWLADVIEEAKTKVLQLNAEQSNIAGSINSIDSIEEKSGQLLGEVVQADMGVEVGP